MKLRFALPVLLVVSAVLAACSTGGTGVSPAPAPTSVATVLSGATDPTPRPTPTPVGAEVNGPADAAALVIATDPRFEGATEFSSDMIGASRYWQATALEDGAYQIVMTLGWGDCMAGCIEQHTWTYRVTADGEVTLLEESGDPVPDGSFPSG